MKSIVAEKVPLDDVASVISNPSYKGRIYWLTQVGRIKDLATCIARRCMSGDVPGSNCDGCNNWEEVQD